MSLLGLAILGRRNEPLYLCDCVRALQEAKQNQKRGNNRRSGPPNRRPDRSGGGRTTRSAAPSDNPVPSEDATDSSDIFDPTDSNDGNKTQEEDQGAGEEVKIGADDDDADDLDPFGFLEAHRDCDLGQSLSFEQSLYLHSALDYVEERIETTSAGLPVVTNGRTGHWLGRLVVHGDDITFDYGDEGNDSANPRVVAYGYITATNIKMLVLVEPPIDKESNVRLFLNGIHDSYISQRMNPFSSVKPGQRITSAKFDAHIREAVRDYEDSRLQQ